MHLCVCPGYKFMGFNRGEHAGKTGIWYREWAPAAKVGALYTRTYTYTHTRDTHTGRTVTSSTRTRAAARHRRVSVFSSRIRHRILLCAHAVHTGPVPDW